MKKRIDQKKGPFLKSLKNLREFIGNDHLRTIEIKR
jgi:hypothetical protein